MKTAEASSAMGISEPTLIRFCKALGFTGYQELKINLSQQLAADDYFVMYEIDQNDTIHELCEKVFDTTISEILNVRSQIDQNVLSDAIEILANAGRVEFYAFGGSAPVAMDGQHKFFRLKIPSSYISDPHIQFMSANSLGKDDVVVVISQSGTTSALIDSVKIVRKSGVKVIGIMPGNTPLASICDYPLVINIGDNNRISKPHTSRIAYTAVIDVLTMGVAQLKPEAQDHLYNIADSQRSLRVKE
jgi:RpiR family carbohydrate utilization transcriptional regulator